MIIAVFAALGGLGIFLFIGGDHQGSTEIVDVRVTAPDAAPDPPDEDSDPPAAATEPQELGDGITAHRNGGSTSFVVAPPPSAASIDVTDASIEVAPATATASGSVLTVTVRCSSSADEFIGQITVDEGTDVVTVAPLVIVPSSGAPCAADASATEMQLPLSAPLGTRGLIVVPAGTPVPELGS